jgi:hypothetical protein
MIVTLRRAWTSINRASSSSEIDLAIVVFPSIVSQISVKVYRRRHTRMGETLKIHPRGLMAPWNFEVKLPYGTQFLFRSLVFNAGKTEPLSY